MIPILVLEDIQVESLMRIENCFLKHMILSICLSTCQHCHLRAITFSRPNKSMKLCLNNSALRFSHGQSNSITGSGAEFISFRQVVVFEKKISVSDKS
jgi:hypothetical protein